MPLPPVVPPVAPGRLCPCVDVPWSPVFTGWLPPPGWVLCCEPDWVAVEMAVALAVGTAAITAAAMAVAACGAALATLCATCTAAAGTAAATLDAI